MLVFVHFLKITNVLLIPMMLSTSSNNRKKIQLNVKLIEVMGRIGLFFSMMKKIDKFVQLRNGA